MAIKDWPAGERPRERLLNEGSGSLSDAELLAIFLRTGVRGRSAVDLARDLLARFGGLRNLLAAPRTTFCEAPGLGDAKFAQLQAVLEMGRRHLHEALVRGEPLLSPDDTRQFLRAQLRDHPYEVFAALFLDLCAAHSNVELDHQDRLVKRIRRCQLHINAVIAGASS